MAIDVNAKQVGRSAIVKHGAPVSTPQQLGTKLWHAFKDVVASFLTPVPSSSRGGVLADVLRLLGGQGTQQPSMGRQLTAQAHVSPRVGMHFDDVVAHAGKEPIASWTDKAIVRARDTASTVAHGLPKERHQQHLFALPQGSVLHEDGHLKTAIDNAPSHVEVRACPYLNTIDDVARFLEREVRRDGKTHASEVNGALIQLGPGTSVADAVKQWEARRKPTADERKANDLLASLEREIDVRQTREQQRTVAERRAAMATQLAALPPGADVFAHDPAKLREEQPGVAVKTAPFLLTLEEAAGWLAKQASTTGNVSAYRFNDDLLVADPRAGRGEALVRNVLDRWEQLH
ncbi:MAG: hypothetical protein HYS27_02725 [Deltaproteobacteria bacterium]|nr:hypothetical protein [Deltaproteobacteria bacterium]